MSHIYYKVVWKVVVVEIPVLEKEIRAILDDFEKKLEANEL
jgi:uncharacterized protein with HEPN domain